MGEFHAPFQHLIDHSDEMLFFNHMRKIEDVLSKLQGFKDMILTHITQLDQTGGLQIQEKVNWF